MMRWLRTGLQLTSAALLVGACSGSDPAGDPQDVGSTGNPILVGIHLHIDPVGLGSPKTPSPTREQRIEEYQRHRETMTWLGEQARLKGFKISAQMTGVYAEFVNKLGHSEDFADYMPGKQHNLGVHLHNHYKGAADTDFTWSEAPLGVSAQAPLVWRDQVERVNEVFAHLGQPASANNVWDAAMAMCQDMGACLGQRTGASYPNKFTIVGGSRDYYNPYRMDWVSDPPRITSEGGAVAAPLGVEGVFGTDGEHGPDGFVHGTLEFAQRDYILAYLEWLHSKTWDQTSRPWSFEVSFHPYDIVAGRTDSKGREVRQTLVSLYDWLNLEFKDSLRYANRAEVVTAYESWEKKNPGEPMFADSDPSTEAIEPRVYVEGIRAALKTSAMFFVSMKREQELETFELKNKEGKRAVLAVARVAGQRLDLNQYFTGTVSRIRMGEKSVTTVQAEPVSLDLVPVLFIEGEVTTTNSSKLQPPTTQGSCGDGTCDDLERRSGMCSADCQS